MGVKQVFTKAFNHAKSSISVPSPDIGGIMGDYFTRAKDSVTESKVSNGLGKVKSTFVSRGNDAIKTATNKVDEEGKKMNFDPISMFGLDGIEIPSLPSIEDFKNGNLGELKKLMPDSESLMPDISNWQNQVDVSEIEAAAKSGMPKNSDDVSGKFDISSLSLESIANGNVPDFEMVGSGYDTIVSGAKEVKDFGVEIEEIGNMGALRTELKDLKEIGTVDLSNNTGDVLAPLPDFLSDANVSATRQGEASIKLKDNIKLPEYDPNDVAGYISDLNSINIEETPFDIEMPTGEINIDIPDLKDTEFDMSNFKTLGSFGLNNILEENDIKANELSTAGMLGNAMRDAKPGVTTDIVAALSRLIGDGGWTNRGLIYTKNNSIKQLTYTSSIKQLDYTDDSLFEQRGVWHDIEKDIYDVEGHANTFSDYYDLSGLEDNANYELPNLDKFIPKLKLIN